MNGNTLPRLVIFSSILALFGCDLNGDLSYPKAPEFSRPHEGETLDRVGRVSGAFGQDEGHTVTAWAGATLKFYAKGDRGTDPIVRVYGPATAQGWGDSIEVSNARGSRHEFVHVSIGETGKYRVVVTDDKGSAENYQLHAACLDGCDAYEAPQSITDFQGSFDPVSGPPVNGVAGDYEGIISIFNLDSAVVASLLPEDLELAPPAGTVTGHHPIMINSNAFSGYMDLVNGEESPGAIADYDELVIAIPYVRKVGGTKLFYFSLIMFLNEPTAVFAGNLFGYNKKEALVTKAGDWERIKYATLLGEPIVELTHAVAEAVPIAEANFEKLPSFVDIAQIFAMPLLGKRDDGTFTCTYFEMDPTNAVVAPADTIARFSSGFISSQSETGQLRMASFPWTGTALPAQGLSDVRAIEGHAIYFSGVHWKIDAINIGCSF